MKIIFPTILLATSLLTHACNANHTTNNVTANNNTNQTQMSQNNTIPLVYQVKEAKGDAAALIIMMHGYGSNDADLFGLAPYFPENYTVVSLQAPHHLGDNSYQWFTIINGNNISIENQEKEVNASEALVVQTIQSLQEKYKISASKTFIGGFSQGGIMSYQIGLKDPNIANGIFVMSGRMLTYLRDEKDKAPVSKLNIFIGHGDADNVLNHQEALNANEWLTKRNYNVTFKTYSNLPHSIAQEEINDILQFFKSHLQQ